MSYDEAFYDVIADGCISSARAVVPLLVELVHPATVVDVGCGEGWWLSVFAEHGCGVYGLDGDYVDRSRLAIPSAADFDAVDLAGEWGVTRTWDLAISLEVAEHLPEASAGRFVEQLCQAAPIVVFSAAIPGQGGTGHLNERWPRDWAEMFQQHGYRVSGALRWEFWDDDRVENWYRQNLLLCVRDGVTVGDRLEALMVGPTAPVWPVVHPVLWDSRR